jgi:hypothetical protein
LRDEGEAISPNENKDCFPKARNDKKEIINEER